MKTAAFVKSFGLEFLEVSPGSKAGLSSRNTRWTGAGEFGEASDGVLKKHAVDYLDGCREELADLQDRLFADDRYSVLIIFQALDAAGKDGTIKHVMSGVNPAGCQVFSFKAPSAEELDHDFLWRYAKALPERGRIGIFNRSYYEEVLVVRVHPEFLEKQRLPRKDFNRDFWRERFDTINGFESHLTRSGTAVIKFFLHVSKAEQRRRLLDRLQEPEKYWKFSYNDLEERRLWKHYIAAFEDALTHTSTQEAPWYVIPADHKWVMRALVSHVIVHRLQALDLRYPKPDAAKKAAIAKALAELRTEGGKTAKAAAS